MRRAVVIATAVILVVLVIYHQGGRNSLQDHREDTLQRAKDISDAIKDSDAILDWREQLRTRNQ
jgi:hypothetical protein